MGKAATKCESSWKNANGYVWGKIIHKPEIHRAGKRGPTLRTKVCCKTVAPEGCRDQSGVAGREGVGLEDGWSLQEASLQGEETSFQALFHLSPQLKCPWPDLMAPGRPFSLAL